jgi:hypothetical protein
MWMLKGVALGLVLFAVFFVIYFRSFAGPLVAGKALSLDLIRYETVYKPLFWVAFVLTLASSCVYIRLLQR